MPERGPGDLPGPALTGLVVLAYGDTPPSLNATRYAHWRAASKEFDRWLGIFEQLLLASSMPPRVSRVKARAVLYFHDGGRRDTVNFRTPIEKALGDALTGSRHRMPTAPKSRKKGAPIWPEGRWLADDTGEFFRFGTVAFAVDPALGRVPAGVSPKTGKPRHSWQSRLEIHLRWWL